MTDSTMVQLVELAKDGAMILAEQIKANAPVLWEMSRKAVIAESIMSIIGSIVFFAVALIATWLCRDVKDCDGDRTIYLIGTVAVFISAIFLIVNVCVGIYNFIAIDWVTLQRILSLL